MSQKQPGLTSYLVAVFAAFGLVSCSDILTNPTEARRPVMSAPIELATELQCEASWYSYYVAVLSEEQIAEGWEIVEGPEWDEAYEMWRFIVCRDDGWGTWQSLDELCWDDPWNSLCPDFWANGGGTGWNGGSGGGGGGGGGENPCAIDATQCGPPPGVDAEEYNQLKPEERRLCWANPHECLSVNGARRYALDFAVDRAEADQFNGGVHNNKYDAMRHAMWNAMMTRTIGASRAQVWATAHEWGLAMDDPERCMDMFNNAVGRQVGSNRSVWEPYTVMGEEIRVKAEANPPQLQISPGC